MPRPYHHGDLRAALLRAAEAILDRDGPNALTLRAAAREAGVTHAAPAHHFGDLTGLLTALATEGFVRFRAHMLAEAAGTEPTARLAALGRGYVEFARASPGLFLLMFRSERLDWSCEALTSAGDAAFGLLLDADADGVARAAPPDRGRLGAAMARWSLVHGLATLLLDGRLAAMSSKAGAASVETVIADVLDRLVET